MSRLGQDRGFTLVELLVTMSLGLLVLGSVVGLLSVMLRQSTSTRNQAEAQDAARTATDGLAAALRNGVVVPGSSVPSVIERADPYDLVFKAVDPFAATGSGLRAIRLRYCLDTADLANEALVLQVQGATSSATPTDTACPSSAWDAGKTRRVAENIVSRIGGQVRPVFGYSPAAWSTLPEIQAIRTDLVVDVAPGARSTERRLTTAVSLRNANRPPVAAVTAGQSGRALVGNGSASADPDGDVLTYTWKIDGVEVSGATTDQLDRGGIALGLHTVTVTVIDPGGLTDTASASVTIR
jgi:prepilin-type N-terminal cleavage/methylation domain-containing protein